MPFYDFRNTETGEVVTDAILCLSDERPDEINPGNYQDYKDMLSDGIDPTQTYRYKVTLPGASPRFKGTDWTNHGDSLYMTSQQKQRLTAIADQRKRYEDAGILGGENDRY